MCHGYPKKKVEAVRYSLASSDTFGHGHRFEKKNTDTHIHSHTNMSLTNSIAKIKMYSVLTTNSITKFLYFLFYFSFLGQEHLTPNIFSVFFIHFIPFVCPHNIYISLCVYKKFYIHHPSNKKKSKLDGLWFFLPLWDDFSFNFYLWYYEWNLSQTQLLDTFYCTLYVYLYVVLFMVFVVWAFHSRINIWTNNFLRI